MTPHAAPILLSIGTDLHNGHPFNAWSHNRGDLKLILTDHVTAATWWSNSFSIDIPTAVGDNTAYVGFTGGTGFDTATQEILTWTFAN
jgi:hypothetical protein